MKLSHFNFELPDELLAEYPAENRDESRLMVLNRKEQTIEHKMFKDLIDYFDEDDVMLIFDFIKDGVVYKGLEYHRGLGEVFNPVRRWAEGHGDNTKHFAYEAICDMLNDELEEIRAKVEEQAMFEKINKGLGIAK
mgnify:CR=1 FL=1